MAQKPTTRGDSLFLKAEQLAHDFSLFPSRLDPAQHIEGLVPRKDIRARLRELRALSVDDYISQTVLPTEAQSRPSGPSILRALKPEILASVEDGPLFAAEVDLVCGERTRRLGFLIQDRSQNNGVWMPRHHEKAVDAIRGFTERSMPIVTFMDTPGADAGAEANLGNQAHSISHLISEMAQIDVPCVGIILGQGYSGGAIPLATANIILSVRDGVFNTIQPQGLASIARKYDLSWQECAKYVGVSAYELHEQGYLDGIIDFVPGERENLENLRRAICTSIDLVESRTMAFVRDNEYIFEHYKRSLARYLTPTSELKRLQEASALSLSKSPTNQPNVFGVAFRYLRYLNMRRKVRSTTIDRYGRLSDDEIPVGDLKKRAEEERAGAFAKWLENPIEVRYDETLQKSWKQYLARKKALPAQAGRIERWVFGTPKSRFEQAQRRIVMEYALYLYNIWKADAPGNFLALITHLAEDLGLSEPHDPEAITVLDVIHDEGVRAHFVHECENLLIFDSIYNNIIINLKSIAREANEFNIVAEDSVRRLIEPSIEAATNTLARQSRVSGESEDETQNMLATQFQEWLSSFLDYPECGEVLKSVENWKKRVFPRLSEPLFAIITFFFEQLLPRHYDAVRGGRRYDGRITPKNIGMKDFWNRLTIAYHDLLIQDLLSTEKRRARIAPEHIIERFFTEFNELDKRLMTADPVGFPGFRLSIEDALANSVRPCGLVTGLGRFRGTGVRRDVGIAISNLAFQAGAFDMASAEKFCHLLVVCARRRVPVICFISSSGMQTKEGAGALFSMPIVNDRITRFVRDLNLPIICFGFGDCTGGAQASFVTHPLVQTFYFSGTNMPFAGQIVVPSYLPSTSTLSNYLSEVDGAMQGLVTHPFLEELDRHLRDIDPKIPLPKATVDEVVSRVLKGQLDAEDEEIEDERIEVTDLVKPIKKVLIHARGCPASKLVRKAQEFGLEVVLVVSDADAESPVAQQLREEDTLVCIGGNTSDESYLNATSVIRVAERERVDALHPGIGFLSENSSFADLCRSHGINFIGPSMHSMEMMGNKSNAINTAMKLDVSVVPGSRGIVTTLESAKTLAERIGYPVLIKAVHGGGGKGIQIVENPSDFDDLFLQICAEARSAFGSSDVYLEKFVKSMRHVEVQIIRDHHANTQVLGLRDCTVQRNNQKIVEESGSTMLPKELEATVYEYSRAIADEINYVGAGTVEYIFDISDNKIYFMEMNTRLQIEHPVTEAVTNVDIVRAQFDIASGESIADLSFEEDGYAIEVRVNAEVPTTDADGRTVFKPCPGEILECIFPEHPAIEILSCIAAGKSVPPFYDNMIVQIIAKGTDRNDSIKTLRAYLDTVRIRGVATNIPLLMRILSDETFVEGTYDTTYLDQFLRRIDVPALIEETLTTSGMPSAKVDAESLKIEGTNELKVVAPSAAVFYLTPSPGEPDLVKVGDTVKTSHRICLLEAMKLFTPLSLDSFNRDGGNGSDESEVYASDKEYKVVKIVPSNGQAVEANDLLFVIEPL
ncbi:MAG: ATP-grasp domain-containing protein [Verrucomicrobia bacterium]|nr:ATP-grasp domain-containing protein [Verrucomicrobiota bacterium]MDA1086921.1 ATP-grasp domain-containing protein [Verrucomicrobiota bacterium]